MTDKLELELEPEPERGSLDHCLAQGVWAQRLLNRFRAVVSEGEMALVRYWFEELHRRADLYLRSGHELVSVGIENRDQGRAGPFMLFNPTKWNGHKRELIAPTGDYNPRKWISVQADSATTLSPTARTSDHALEGGAVRAAPVPSWELHAAARKQRDSDRAFVPALEVELH